MKGKSFSQKRIYMWGFLYCIVIMLAMPCSALGVPEPGKTLKERYAAGTGNLLLDVYDIYNESYYGEIEIQYGINSYEAANANGAPVEIVLDKDNIKKTEEKNIPLKSGIGGKKEETLVWEEGNGFFEWEFEVDYAGLYEILVEYYPIPSSGAPVVRSFSMDGKFPFSEAHKVEFPRMWADEGEPRINSVGDEVRPKQKEVLAWRFIPITDSEGMYPTPYKFYLEKGKHVLRMDFLQEPCAIGRIIIRTPEEIPSYLEVLRHYNENGYKNAARQVKFQAENAVIEKSDTTLRRETDGDPMTEPASMGYRKLNVMGSWRWRMGNQSVTWEFEVPESGLYKIGIRFAQWWNNGLPAYRQISINGRVPFKEMLAYKFKYGNNWRFEYLSDDDGNPYLFYLERGTNTLTMTVKMGDYASLIQGLNKDILLLSQMIRKIIMLTGSEPDVNFDYQFDKNIPGLLDAFAYLAENLEEKAEFLREISGMRPGIANNLYTISNQLKRMIRDPFSIARRLNELEQAQVSLGSWVLSLKEGPLAIDYFIADTPGAKPPKANSSIFQKLWATFRNFIISFNKDYDAVGSVFDSGTEIKERINVWVARGTEWAEVIKEMADTDFTPETGILVNLNVVPSSQMQSSSSSGSVNALLLAVVSGQAPDVALGVSADTPVEFAIRDAVYDLSKFDDFPVIKDRFLDNIFIPFKYRNGVFALPETMGFYVMFYRKDILKELGIALPETREELYNHVLPLLYQHGMQFYYPAEFSQFLFQHGADFYTPDGMRSALDTPEAYMGFKECCELFSHYGIPVQANFYNRFRTGEMPIGLGGYSMYIQLSVAAPELTGRWGIAPIPGIRKADGTVDRSIGLLAGQTSIILAQSKKSEEAWKFLKWWTSTHTQESFAREIEALVGGEARWNTANVEAFKNLSWDREHLEVIREYWNWARETPVVLGGYYTNRYLQYAWNNVVILGLPVRDALEYAVKEINREMIMKQEEYGVLEKQTHGNNP